MIYSVTIYDEQGERATVLRDVSNPSYARSKNTADQITFSLPRNDPKISEIKTGRFFEIIRTLDGQTYTEASGYISNHTYGEDEYDVEGYTEEIVLTRYLTPPQYGYVLQSENQNLKTLTEALDRGFLFEQVKFDWSSYIVDESNVDYTTEPSLMLLQNQNPGGQASYPSSGYVVFRFDKDNDERWDRFRWVSDFYKDDQGGEVATRVSYRTGNDLGNLPAFSTPQAGAETDVVGIVIAAAPASDDQYLEVRVDFSTTTSNASPVLFSLEAIRRTPPIFDGVDISTGAEQIITPGLQADSTNFFDVLTSAFEPSGFEFEVRGNTLYVANTFGTDRTNEYSVVGS